MTTAAKPSAGSDPLAPFSPAVRRWFEASFAGPTPAQAGGWEAISGGANALICAPTGSGEDARQLPLGDRQAGARPAPGAGVRLVYVSPLKALSYDIERNLRAPLRGIGADIAVGLRTGDTSQKERRAMAKTPPEILITTPESLYLMLSSQVREILATHGSGDRRRDPRGRPDQAGGASGADLGAAGAPGSGGPDRQRVGGV